MLRSEEHTSELQSRFGISYAVFCLKKKKKKQHCCAMGAEDPRSLAIRTKASRRTPLYVRDAVGPAVHPVCLISSSFVFFLKDGGPPDFSPFPLPALFRS